MGKVLVTGACGYIGSHTLIDLIDKGFDPVCLDNLSNSDDSVLDSVEQITGKKLINHPVDLRNFEKLNQFFKSNNEIDSVIHFAALKAVGESVEKPLLYYDNNINGLLQLCKCCLKYNVKQFIFSSSCTVYGNAEKLPVSEESPLQAPESPYGATKQMSEQIINDILGVRGIKIVHLRYFNPAGAHESGLIGESPKNIAQNLVPVITETAIGKRERIIVFGKDYNTRDGSCIRDYIHIMDLADAHTRALQFLQRQTLADVNEVFNLGIGKGVSVLEAIQAFEKVSKMDLNYEIGPRRSGDVVAIYADYKKALDILGWKPKRDIDAIMETAWKWEKNRIGAF